MAENIPKQDCGSSDSPLLCVVLITPDSLDTLSTTLQHLQAQTIAGSLEIMIVAPSSCMMGLPREIAQTFARVEIVGLREISSLGRAYAAGIERATAPLVAFGEDHSFPHFDWAERLVRAHREPWAGVGPLIRNANPESVIAVADFLIAYGPWSEPAQSAEVEHLPGHNCCYKRSLLLEYGSSLADMLEAESVLHWDLRRSGHRLYLESAARTSHVNFSNFWSWLAAQYYWGRIFGAFRAGNENWSPARRAWFAVAGPLIPLVRLCRIMQWYSQPAAQKTNLVPFLFPALCVGLAFDGLGQMIGYSLGVGSALRKGFAFEFHRERHLCRNDRHNPRNQRDSVLAGVTGVETVRGACTDRASAVGDQNVA